MRFKFLFRSSDQPKDGFTQEEREAIVDILHYGMYADHHLSVSEDQAIEAAVRTLDWDPRISYEFYEGKSTGIVRAAMADPERKEAFFESLRARLKNPDHRKFALNIVDDLMKAEGLRKDSEKRVSAELRKALGEA